MIGVIKTPARKNLPMIETSQKKLYLALSLSLFAFAGCAVNAADDPSDVESAENELAVCSAAASLELLNVKVRDQEPVFGASRDAVAISPSQTLNVLPGHTYIITADLHNKDTDTTRWVDYPGIVLKSSVSKVTTAVTSPQTFAIMAGTTQEQTATFTIPADACIGSTGKVYLAPTANFGACKGPVTNTYNFKVTSVRR
jgi:hypothetical protein